jgi:hypothetical protein
VARASVKKATGRMIKNTVEYKLISRHYGDKVAKRSQVPLMNHINEGLIVLDRISATDQAKRAFCLHPLLQADTDLKENCYLVSFVEPHVLLLTMEYRSVANEFLSDKIPAHKEDTIRLSPLFEVNEMLVADKVQNYKDFITYHRDTHTRSKELSEYFLMWLAALDITAATYNRLCKAIDESKV